MASVSSLDQDMRRLRMQKAKDPAAVNETTTWIEETLGQKLPPGDLMDALKDGTILCQLANLAIPPPGIKFKKSAMPFMQMENISHFLKACEKQPIGLHAHDRFLTVDLFEKKDPAQVLQCLASFSRIAHSLNPAKFPTCIGPKKSNGSLSPGLPGRDRGLSNASTGSGAKPPPLRALSPSGTGGSNSSSGARSPGPTSSWSRRNDEGVTSPAWNIAQYGYMGGANAGNQGVVYGARRQITTAAPHVPSAAEKERKRKEQEAEAERKRKQAEEADAQQRATRGAEESRARAEEERRWEEETRKQREQEKLKVEQQKREWEEQERKWKADEEARLREEREAEEQLEKETQHTRANSDARLRGQFLTQYQAEQGFKPRSRQVSRNDPELEAERQRVADLERQLAEAKERERQYQREREERIHGSRPGSARPPSPPESNVSWAGDEREYLRQQWDEHNRAAPALPSRPLPDPATASPPPLSPRPLPNPADYMSAKSPKTPKSPISPISPPSSNRTDRFLSSNPAPFSPPAKRHTAASEIGFTSAAERSAEDERRAASQRKTKAGGWASKSLLEREMERERQRQKEWEEGQQRLKETPRDASAGSNPGQSWDVNQYGFTGGDSQNRVGSGIGFGGRRPIIGPRPRP
ncbi:calponin domain-containing protein [Diplodia corticola]|uniref:Calponin domain-containing protein n=1 Tax=Diplodia corticola TaxID=236234 RepID=A0A1J9QL45_9PEZI|nr:calponin domain-containing protein [Diplodia corticola]OJD29185.1 calponin domain-containing protein [Diplodia corticola]